MNKVRLYNDLLCKFVHCISSFIRWKFVFLFKFFDICWLFKVELNHRILKSLSLLSRKPTIVNHVKHLTQKDSVSKKLQKEMCVLLLIDVHMILIRHLKDQYVNILWNLSAFMYYIQYTWGSPLIVLLIKVEKTILNSIQWDDLLIFSQIGTIKKSTPKLLYKISQ